MKYKKSVFRNLALITQLGFTVLASVFLCVFIGYEIDKHLHTHGWAIIVFILLGTVSGGLSAYKLVKSMLRKEIIEDDKLRDDEIKAASKKKVTVVKPKRHSRVFKEDDHD